MDLAVASSQLMVNLRALDLGASALMIGVLLGACWGIPYVAVSMATGTTVRRLGARWTMALGSAMFAVSVAAYGSAHSTGVLLAAAPLGGAGSALFWPAMQTCLPAETPDETRIRSGVFNMSWTLGILIGGAAAGHAYRLAGPRWSFWFVAIIIGAVTAIVIARVKAVSAPVGHGEPAAATAPSPHGGEFLLLARVANFVMWFLGAAAGAVFPRIARALGFDDGSIGEIAAAVWLGQVGAFALVSRGAWWQWRVLPLAAALCVGMAAMAFLAWGAGAADSVMRREPVIAGLASAFGAGAVFVTGFALIGIARALTHASSMHYSLLVGPSPEANMGYHEAIIGGGFVLGPLAAGFAADTLGLRGPFLLSALLGMAALVAAMMVKRSIAGGPSPDTARP